METRPPPPQDANLLGRREECALLLGLVEDVRSGLSRTLVVHGEAGIGKTALLGYLTACSSNCTIVQALGIESEMELAYAGLQQVYQQLNVDLASLPTPQRNALEIVFGISSGESPGAFLVALAMLGVLSNVADRRPLVVVVDDAQWLDRASAVALVFIARRLQAEPVGIVFATRELAPELRHMPDMHVTGLRHDDGRALLLSSVPSRLDEQVCDRIVAETRGNPLALLELPRGLSTAELAGFVAGSGRALPTSLEESFVRRLSALPLETQHLLLIAAAEPLGEPGLLWRAARLQGISPEAATPAIAAELCEFGDRIRFRHPLVRAAAYVVRPPEERRRAHAAIAEATDGDQDPDRRAWHRANAAEGPDDDVADELERSAMRARARGGEAAAAALLERSATLTVDRERRTGRALAAAESHQLAGSGDAALRLAAVAERQPLDELGRVRVGVLGARVATMQRRFREAPPLLLAAAQRLELIDGPLARETYRDAYIAAQYAGSLAAGADLIDIARAIRSAPPAADPPSATDTLLDAAALLVDAGYATGAPAVREALAAFRRASLPADAEMHWLSLACLMAHAVWDDESWDALSTRYLNLVRDGGMLASLPRAAFMRVAVDIFSGELTIARAHFDEGEAALAMIGGGYSPTSRITVAAFAGDAEEVRSLDQTIRDQAIARGDGLWLEACSRAIAVLSNGQARYQETLAVGESLLTSSPAAMGHADWLRAELIEAAARCGRTDAAAGWLTRLGEMAEACGTPWILGLESRSRALLAGPADADVLYRTAIEHLGKTRLRTELARAHLVYGEWLRRENRRTDARGHLRTAYQMLEAIGMNAFADRAARELVATGETARKRTVDTRDDLTAQELQIAQMARDGLSNPEIGSRLFLSPRTVEWHLGKVFGKLDVRSRFELAAAMSGSDRNVGARDET